MIGRMVHRPYNEFQERDDASMRYGRAGGYLCLCGVNMIHLSELDGFDVPSCPTV